MVKLFSVTLNHYGELQKVYTHAKNEKTALNNAIRQFCKNNGLNQSFYRAKFLGKKSNFTIKEIKKDEPTATAKPV